MRDTLEKRLNAFIIYNESGLSGSKDKTPFVCFCVA